MNTFVMGTLDFAKDVIDSLLDAGVEVTGVIGLSDRDASDNISGYNFLRPFSESRNLDFYEVISYSISDSADVELIQTLEIDYLIVIGWQRLIPSWLITHTRKLVIGCHGSPLGITRGRGRSPQNWSLILGCTDFFISIFQIDEGTDSGPVISTRKFEYTEHDDIRTSYYKVGLLTAEMITDFFRAGCNVDGIEYQDEASAEYLPQRLPEDGYIDWDRSGREIFDFIRALTTPYPGAVAMCNGNRFKVLEAKPFDLTLKVESVPGTVVKVFQNGDVLVQVKNSFLLITEYVPLDTQVLLVKGDVMDSHNFEEQLQKINERHMRKYPALPLSSLTRSIGS